MSWSEGTVTRVRVDAFYDKLKIERQLAFCASTSPALCAFVANGSGVALAHPLYIGIAQLAITVCPFKPRLELDILVAFPKPASRPTLVKAFAEERCAERA